MSDANSKQVDGSHYKDMPLEHWDVVAIDNLDYFQGQITKYVMRWRAKGGIKDLEKGLHTLQKYIEVEKLRSEGKLTIRLLMAALAKLEQAEQPVQPVLAVITPVIPGASNGADEQPARRVCNKCLHVLPMHAIGCSEIGATNACELCGGVSTHLPTCPVQR